MSNLAYYHSTENENYRTMLIQNGEPVDYLSFMEEINGKFLNYLDILMSVVRKEKAVIKCIEKELDVDFYHNDKNFTIKDMGIKQLMWLSDKGTKFTLPQNSGSSFTLPNYSFKYPNKIEYGIYFSYPSSTIGEEGKEKLDAEAKVLFEWITFNIYNEYNIDKPDNREGNIHIFKKTRDFTIGLKLDLDEGERLNNEVTIKLIATTSDSLHNEDLVEDVFG